MNPFLSRLASGIAWIDDRGVTALLAAQVRAQEHPALAQLRQSSEPQAEVVDGVAVLPIRGALMQTPSVWELASGEVEDTGSVTKAIRNLTTARDTKAVVLDLSTPGGMVPGGLELADAVESAARVKPVVAWTGSQAASLGYLIASQADAIMASRSAEVGSIGTVATILDASEMAEKMGVKVHTFVSGDLKRLTPMNEERAAHVQARVDAAFAEFKRMVLAKRPGIQESAMRGQMFVAPDALQSGLIDAIGSREDAVTLAGSLA